jgi:hypothetical protein
MVAAVPARSASGGEIANRRLFALAIGSSPRQGKVSFEFIGLARQLCRRLGKAQALYEARADRLLGPFRPRLGFTPAPRRTHLVRLGREWRRLPRLGRLRSVVNDTKPGALNIAETRLVPSQLALPWWDDADGELALVLVLSVIALAPPRFVERSMMMAAVGLHAIARRFERGDRDEIAVVNDFVSLGRAYPEVARIAGEFRVATGSGIWRGAVKECAPDGQPVMVVRTFVQSA